MSQYDKFYGYLSELNENHSKLSALLLTKLDAIEKFDIGRLDEVVKEEQVFVLQSKSFDNNIAKYREQLSLRGDKLSDIIGELPAGEQQRFHELFGVLKRGLCETQALNDKCQELLEERLHTINKAMKELDKTRGGDYGKADSAPSDAGARLLSKTI